MVFASLFWSRYNFAHMWHDAELSSALASLSRGISPAHSSPHAAVLESARLASSGCTTAEAFFPGGQELVSFTHCPAQGLVNWGGASGLEWSARAQPALDALLYARSDDDDRTQWMTVPRRDGSETIRQVATAAFVGNASSCLGAEPLVVRLRYFCGDPARASLMDELPPATPATPALLQLRSDGSHFGRTRSVDVTVRQSSETPRCQLDGFVELPSLCVPPFDDPSPRRLDRLLRGVYDKARHSGFVNDASAEGGALPSPPSISRRALTYGELSGVGMLQVVEALRHADGGSLPGTDEAIVDVGSGVGKAVLAFAILMPSARSVGVEFVSERARRAAAALADATRNGYLEPQEAERVTLVEDDATRPGALPEDTVWVYLSNLCFADDLNRKVLLALLQAAPRLRCIAALRELVDSRVEGQRTSSACPRLALVSTVRVSMSWDDLSRLHIYCCRPADAPPQQLPPRTT